MNIPHRCQIFDHPIEVSDKEYARLRPCLTGWNKLNALFTEGITEFDLLRLVVIELTHQHRKVILNRLLGRLSKVQRVKYNKKIRASRSL
jgi:hypothetical protein